jgi:enoyl-CoA hydratase/carnithine racemase
MAAVEYLFRDDVARLTLNRPTSLNAINREMHDGIVSGLARARDDAAAVVVLAGNGPSFSAGGDIKAVAAGEDVGDPADLAAAMAATPMPIVAAVHGYCLGQAFELVQCCDLAVATRDSMFGEVEIRHGWGPPVPVTPRVLSRKHAMEVLLLGELVDAPTVLRLGVVNRVVDSGELEREVAKLTDQLCVLDRTVVAANKALVNASWLPFAPPDAGDASGRGPRVATPR